MLSKCSEKAGHLHPTYFEWLYLMAMLWFGRQGIEYGTLKPDLVADWMPPIISRSLF